MFSLDSFTVVLKRAINLVQNEWRKKRLGKSDSKDNLDDDEEGEKKEEDEVIEELDPKQLTVRVQDLVESITIVSFDFIRRGTLEKHKIIVAALLCFRIMAQEGAIDQRKVDHLIAGQPYMDKVTISPVIITWLQNEYNFLMLKGLETIYPDLIKKVEGDTMLWRSWYGTDKPELENLPKSIDKQFNTPFDKMLFLRAIRPDRLISALTEFVRSNMGEQ